MNATEQVEEIIPTISSNPVIQAAYQRMRLAGESHMMAEMLAFRQPCGTKDTDRAFLQGKQNGEELKELPVGMAKRKAEAYKRQTGRSIPQGSVYLSTAAEKPGDARAYFDSIDDVKRHCRKTGAGCEALGIKPVDVGPPPKKVDYNPRLLKRRMQMELMKPENKEKAKSPKAMQKLAEEIKGKHTYRIED